MKFTIVGARPRKELIDYIKNDDSVYATGTVDDVRNYIAKAAVAVAPIRVSAGVQNKILETMSMGVPTVTTFQGAEGLPKDNNPLLVCENEEEFANQVCSILNNKIKRNTISNTSVDFCKKNFSWAHCAEILNQNFRSMIYE